MENLLKKYEKEMKRHSEEIEVLIDKINKKENDIELNERYTKELCILQGKVAILSNILLDFYEFKKQK